MRYIGQPVIATNDNYILHLMIDMQNQKYLIRAYDKNSNYYSTALFDYKLPPESKTNYFVFPSFFLDIFFYRDEEVVALVRMSENTLVIDATNNTLFKSIFANQSVRISVI